MADPCPKCEYIHTSTDAYAVGRFDPTSEPAYQSSVDPDAPLRTTRAEAVADTCRYRTRPTEGDPT